MRLSSFINENLEPIGARFEAFARTVLPASSGMADLALRDHVVEILRAIAIDMESLQSEPQRQTKSEGRAPVRAGGETAAAAHGAMRQLGGFDLNQLGAEFRALRATVLRLWKDELDTFDADTLEQMTRFNEGLDQAIAESTVSYSARVAESRDLFLAVLGHDLRSPLGSLSGCIQLLTTFNPPEEKRKRALDIANRSVATMDTMLTDLLEYTRSRLGKGIEVVLATGDFGALCEATVEEVRAAYPGSDFVFERSGNLELEFDSPRMHQVLANLLGNAVQHGDPTQPIRAQVIGEPDLVVASVSNRGVPIPAASHAEIFNPMVQLARAKRRNDHRPLTSMGLGLFIAREIVKAHGAEINVTSSEAQGTVFTIRIPRNVYGHAKEAGAD
jgi:signal transduction histidine kinase